MRIFVRKILARVVGPRTRRFLKRLEFQAHQSLAKLSPRLDRAALEGIFRREMGLVVGDVVMVHASTAKLNTTLSNQDIIAILLEIVGESGTIVVPTFPRAASIDTMTNEEAFDARADPSGMGGFSEALRRTSGSSRSTHPTKSVAALGLKADWVCQDHEHCLYPFGPGSPFAKMHDSGVKIIGLGVPMSYLSFVHVAEDFAPERVRLSVWDPATYEKRCIRQDGTSVNVRTKIHDMALMQRADPEKFCKANLNPTEFRIFQRGTTPFFLVDGRVLFQRIFDAIPDRTIYD